MNKEPHWEPDPKPRTLADFAESYLVSQGLWPDEARALVDAAMASPLNAALDGRWRDAFDGYAVQVQAAMILSLRHIAADWLAKNKPEHFARGMFSAERKESPS